MEESSALRELIESDESVRKIVKIAGRLEGLSRHAGMHAAGVVIAPRPIIEYLPLYRTNKDEITTQFDMNAVEEMGLLKIDFLGLITLDIIDETLAAIRDRTGQAPDLTACLWTTRRPTSSSDPERRPASSSSTPPACGTCCGGPGPACSRTWPP